MDSETWVEQLLALPDAAVQHQFLRLRHDALGEDAAELLKEHVIQWMRVDIQRALAISDLILVLADLTQNPLHRAVGLRAEAQARAIGLGQHQQALDLYDEAMQICAEQGDEVGHARIQVTRIYPLAYLGRYEEAFEAGERADQVLEAHAQWRSLATLTMNLALIHGRLGKDAQSLAMLDKARYAYQQLGEEGEPFLAQAEHNRAVVLRNLGHYDRALDAAQTALAMHLRLGHRAEAARTHQNLALTYLALGRYNDALEGLDHARAFFLADGRHRDGILTDLFISNCLLQLRRFPEALEKCQRARALFAEIGTQLEVAEATVNQAIASTGLGRYDQALALLAEAKAIFQAEGNQFWLGVADLEIAATLFRKSAVAQSLATAQQCAELYRHLDLPVEEAQACLVAARAAGALQQIPLAQRLLNHARSVGEQHHLPSLSYHCYQLSGSLLQMKGQPEEAVAEYDRAIQMLEQLRGRLMLEHRIDFLDDKQVVYEDVVGLYLEMAKPDAALEYAERAKSRALLDMLANRLDIGVHARREADQPLVAELLRLRTERDRLYRRWASDARDEQLQARGWPSAEEGRQQAQEAVVALEKQITELWHTLLIHNADYARDAALWQVRTEPIQPYLDASTVLLEFFVVRQTFVVFVVTSEKIEAVRLPATVNQVQQLLRLFRLNLAAVPRSAPHELSALTANAQGLLKRLYQSLIAPLSLPSEARLIIVPHGPLHYLPFHALFDGQNYLLEQYEISYLPSASMLRYAQEVPEGGDGAFILGTSYDGRLPYAVEEAHQLAALTGSTALVEQDATVQALHGAATCRVVHLATHGDFRQDNPLFSGLALSDGWLTTLDIFNLHLRASLVTLSACQTGRSVLGGGDELLGFTRAFLAAGAASLVVTLWMVEDRSTAQLMTTFYQALAHGASKGAALRVAQRRLLQETASDSDTQEPIHRYQHPYFWAPFLLVGHAGLL